MADVSTYIVRAGDTLSELAQQFGTTVTNLVNLNNIADPNFITIGQILKLNGEPDAVPTNVSQRPTISVFGLQSDTDRTVYANWTWTKSNTDHYEVMWKYITDDGVSFIGNDGTENNKQSIYTAPANAASVTFTVKAIARTRTVNNQEVAYWNAQWSTTRRYYFRNNPPMTPDVPEVTIEDYKLTASLSNLDVNATSIEFQVVKNDTSVFSKGTATIRTSAASYSVKVTAGHNYKVRCRAVRGKLYSDWSQYSSNFGTAPSMSKTLTLKALSETSIRAGWGTSATATSYEVEYTTDKSLFNSSTDPQKVTVEAVTLHAEITGLESGNEYFVRVRAINDQGASAWTDIKSIKIGTAPAAPTTWSSTTTAIVGESVNLYWVHNSEDGSNQTYAELQLVINGNTTTRSIRAPESEEDENPTSVYTVATSGYTEGTTILWRVRTRGIMNAFGAWSIQRRVDVYAPPTLELQVVDRLGAPISVLNSFPLRVSLAAGPSTQTPIGYSLSIIANESYETVDSIGNPKMVKRGEEIHSTYLNYRTDITWLVHAGGINLDNNREYTVKCTVAMSSGLSATSTEIFEVQWQEDACWPDAQIIYNSDTYTTSIRPFCLNGSEELASGFTLAVYRREFDGSFTELVSGIYNGGNTFITDPHPSLDFARYRIVATENSTGAVSFYDVPGYPVEEKAIIIQWDDQWTDFDTDEAAELDTHPWSGSLLRLPYNVDVSESNAVDVTLVEYIGRKEPVSYYGTQLGVTSTWNVAIEKDDKETLYALRRLAIWTGDVYVREPSGIGYWANISVSITQTHAEKAVPVTLDIKRVAGGV